MYYGNQLNVGQPPIEFLAGEVSNMFWIYL